MALFFIHPTNKDLGLGAGGRRNRFRVAPTGLSQDHSIIISFSARADAVTDTVGDRDSVTVTGTVAAVRAGAASLSLTVRP